MIDLSSWTDEDLRAGLFVIQKSLHADLAKMGLAVLWNEAFHPRGMDGKFIGSGVEEGRNIVDGIIHGMHDGMTQRSRATHLRVYKELKAHGLHAHAAHYWTAVNKARAAKQTLHPRTAFGKANYAIHTGDPSHLEAASLAPKAPAAVAAKPNVPQFKIEKHFIESPGARQRVRDEGTAYLQTLKSGDRAIIAKYTGDWYGTVNPELRTGVMSASERANVEKLDQALRESKTTENTMVGRSTSETVLNKLRKAGIGGIFQDPAFVSTAMRKGKGEGYGSGEGVQIEVPKGSPGIFVNSISKHGGEDEFLLPRESEFEIVAVKNGGQSQNDFTIRYLGSNKAANRPDVAASLTEVKVQVPQAAVPAAHLQGQSAVPMPTPKTTVHSVVAQATPDSAQYPVGNGVTVFSLSGVVGSSANKIDGPHGSQPGQWYETGGGTQYYAKPMSASRAFNEVGAQRAYVAMGATQGKDVPYTWVAQNNDQYYVVSAKIENLNTASAEDWKASAQEDGPPTASAAKLWAADVLLSHWDVAGLSHDNLVVDNQFNAIRIDTGGAMRYRAQGAVKDNWKPGGSWVEPWTMRGLTPPPGYAAEAKAGTQTKNIFGRMSNQDAADAMIKLRTRMEVDGGLESMVTGWVQMGMSSQDIAFNKAVIEGRLNSIPAIVNLLMQHPDQVALPGQIAA